MSTYEELDATIDLIVDAAIESAMAFAGWRRDGDDYVNASQDPFYHGLDEIRLSGPGQGEPKLLKKGIGGDLLDGVLEQWRQAAADIYSGWDSKVREAFATWGFLPEPSSMTEGIDDTIAAVRRISLGDVVGDGPRVPANPQLADLAEANGFLEEYLGGTVSAFRRNYSRRLELAILPNQCGIACEIVEGMLAEVAVMNEARKSVASVADGMLNGMKQARPAPESSGAAEGLLTVLGVGASVAGMFATGGASLFVSSIGIGLGLIDTLGGDEKKVPMEETTPDEVLATAVAALDDLDADIRTEEERIESLFAEVGSTLSGDPASYDLAAPTDLLGATTPQELIQKENVLQVDAKRFRAIGGIYLPNVAAEIEAAASGLEPYDVRGSWYRSGSHGTSSTGPSAAYETASNAVALVLANTAQELRQAAGHLVIAAGWFDETEQEVRSGFAQERRDVEAAGVPGLPYSPPAPPPQPRHGGAYFE